MHQWQSGVALVFYLSCACACASFRNGRVWRRSTWGRMYYCWCLRLIDCSALVPLHDSPNHLRLPRATLLAYQVCNFSLILRYLSVRHTPASCAHSCAHISIHFPLASFVGHQSELANILLRYSKCALRKQCLPLWVWENSLLRKCGLTDQLRSVHVSV